MSKKEQRRENLLPNGIPKHVRVYDNGGISYDRYTVVFSGNWNAKQSGYTLVLAMSCDPYFPLGFCQLDYVRGEVDRPRYSHLGKKIDFYNLPEDCRKAVLEDYRDVWRL